MNKDVGITESRERIQVKMDNILEQVHMLGDVYGRMDVSLSYLEQMH